MKKIFVLISVSLCALNAVDPITLDTVNAQKHKKMHVLFGLISPDEELKNLSQLIKNDLEFTGQFSIDADELSELKTKKQIKKLFAKGYSLAIYLKPSSGGFEWYLYDTSSAQMLSGKKIQKKQGHPRVIAHAVSDELWPALTGNIGFFSTKIVYGKEVCRRGRDCKKYIYTRDATDLDGTTEELLVASPTISISPRWNRDLNNPMVLYSEYTKTNVRLIAVNMKGKRSVVSDFEGVNMQVSYSPEGKEVVYCLSRAPHSRMKPHSTSQLYHYGNDPDTNEATFKRLTSNNGNNFAPCWGPNETLFYTSDASHNGLPNICWYNFKDKKMAWLTQNSYATSPNYSPVSNKLVYSKMVNRIMQLCEFDLGTKQHRQLTFSATNKDDCSWSPCGNIIAYSEEIKGRGRLAMLNLLTREHYYLTPEGENYSYPSWSPAYSNTLVTS